MLCQKTGLHSEALNLALIKELGKLKMIFVSKMLVGNCWTSGFHLFGDNVGLKYRSKIMKGFLGELGQKGGGGDNLGLNFTNLGYHEHRGFRSRKVNVISTTENR